MSDHYVIRENKKHCLYCNASYSKTVSTTTLTNHYNKVHKNQPCISLSTNNKLKIANTELSSKMAKAFALLNWPLHHVNSPAFQEIIECIRQSTASMPHRKTLRSKTLSVAKAYQEK